VKYFLIIYLQLLIIYLLLIHYSLSLSCYQSLNLKDMTREEAKIQKFSDIINGKKKSRRTIFRKTQPNNIYRHQTVDYHYGRDYRNQTLSECGGYYYTELYSGISTITRFSRSANRNSLSMGIHINNSGNCNVDVVDDAYIGFKGSVEVYNR
jgi:hypothetical protein